MKPSTTATVKASLQPVVDGEAGAVVGRQHQGETASGRRLPAWPSAAAAADVAGTLLVGRAAVRLRTWHGAWPIARCFRASGEGAFGHGYGLFSGGSATA
jgi:hypothetical protein